MLVLNIELLFRSRLLPGCDLCGVASCLNTDVKQ